MHWVASAIASIFPTSLHALHAVQPLYMQSCLCCLVIWYMRLLSRRPTFAGWMLHYYYVTTRFRAIFLTIIVNLLYFGLYVETRIFIFDWYRVSAHCELITPVVQYELTVWICMKIVVNVLTCNKRKVIFINMCWSWKIVNSIAIQTMYPTMHTIYGNLINNTYAKGEKDNSIY